MNDFLSRLTGRSLGLAEVMRPRLASLFEPTPSAPGEFLEGASLHGVVLEDGVLSADAGSPPEARGPAREVTTRGGASAASNWPGRVNRIVESAPPSQAAGPDRGGEQARSPEPRAALAPVDHVKPLSRQPDPSLSEMPSMRRSAPDSEARPALAPKWERAGERFARQPESEAERHREEPLAVPHELRPTTGPADSADGRSTPVVPSTIVRPRLPTYPEPARLPRSRRGAMPEPTIHVTIGRVEVRATPSAVRPATSRQRPRPTPMSLDEYLDRRARRGGK